VAVFARARCTTTRWVDEGDLKKRILCPRLGRGPEVSVMTESRSWRRRGGRNWYSRRRRGRGKPRLWRPGDDAGALERVVRLKGVGERRAGRSGGGKPGGCCGRMDGEREAQVVWLDRIKGAVHSGHAQPVGHLLGEYPIGDVLVLDAVQARGGHEAPCELYNSRS